MHIEALDVPAFVLNWLNKCQVKETKVLLKVFQFEGSVLKVRPLRSTLPFTSSSSLLSKGARASDHSSVAILHHSASRWCNIVLKEVRKARETIRWHKWDMHYGNMLMQNRIRMNQNNEGIQKERGNNWKCSTAWVCKSVRIGRNYDVSKQTIDTRQSQDSITSHRKEMDIKNLLVFSLTHINHDVMACCVISAPF